MLSEISKAAKRVGVGLGLAAALGCVCQAQAAQFVGKWDPAFGSPFNDLGWKGSATFDIPDACLALNGTVTVTNFSSCASGGLKLLSADVDFYDLSNPNSVLDTLSFATPSIVLSMTVSDHLLSGVVGGFLMPEHSDLSIAGGDTDFWLSFVKSGGSNFAMLAFLQYGPCHEYEDERFSRETEKCIVDSGFSQISADQEGGRPLMTFSVVPEPGSFALMLAALGLLVLVRQRKRAVLSKVHR